MEVLAQVRGVPGIRPRQLPQPRPRIGGDIGRGLVLAQQRLALEIEGKQGGVAERGIHVTPGPAFELAIVRVPDMQRRRLEEIVQIVIAEEQEDERGLEGQEAGQEDTLVGDRRAQHAGIQDVDGARAGAR